jgi:alcohol dehydrogenase (cytochrome c)
MGGAIRAAAILGALAAGLASPATLGFSQTPPADAGAAAYSSSCANCHGRKLEGGFAPPLSGAGFRQKWDGKGAELTAYATARMPPAAPGSLGPELTGQIVAYIQRSNGMTATASATPAAGIASGRPAALTSPSGVRTSVNYDRVYQETVDARTAQAARLEPVSEAALAKPAPGDWPAWRRDYAAHGFSPLAQIDHANVGRLRLAWSLALAKGTNQIAPLAWQGVLFVNSTGTVQAIDGATGDVLWETVRPSGKGLAPLSQPRAMALYGGSLFVPTIDNHMLALDARTGKLLWDHEIAVETKRTELTGGPIVAHGKVIQGAAGCGATEVPGGCFIVALDAATGAEVWRFDTIARPGKPGDESWNGAPLAERFGASVWLPGSYDPDLNLVYFGTGQTYHAAPLMNGRAVGPKNAALYTNSTLALDPDTGKLAWYFQHFPRDVWDLDWSFERQLVTLTTPKGPRRAVMTIGKLGILDALDAKTGQYLFSRDLGLQDLVSGVDPKTGRKIVDPARQLEAGKPQHVCPYAAGVRNWPSTAYDAASGTLYVPMTEDCMMASFDPSTPSDGRWQEVPRPDADGKFGRVGAMDLASGKFRWTERVRAPQTSAVLATGGRLIFEGGRDRMFRARDAETGAVLWSVRLDAVPNAFPIAFEAGGREYVAITTGTGGPGDAARRPLTPEIKDPPPTTTLWVFALPD